MATASQQIQPVVSFNDPAEFMLAQFLSYLQRDEGFVLRVRTDYRLRTNLTLAERQSPRGLMEKTALEPARARNGVPVHRTEICTGVIHACARFAPLAQRGFSDSPRSNRTPWRSA